MTANSTVLSDTLGLRLWYKGLDDKPDFNDDLHDFGGWGTANQSHLRKQFKRNQQQCKVSNLNLDFQGPQEEGDLRDWDSKPSAADGLSAVAFEKTANFAVHAEFESKRSSSPDRFSRLWSVDAQIRKLHAAYRSAVEDDL